MTRGPLSYIEKFKPHLFSEKPPELTPEELKVVERYEAAFAVWLDKPTMPDKELREYMIKEYQISSRQAYEDINNIKILLGNVTNARKEWQRYKVISMLDEAFNMAKKEGDIKSMVMAADKLGKYTQLDQADGKELPWDQIIPQTFEPTDDPTVLGLKPLPNLPERIRKLKEKYGAEIDIEEAQYAEPGPGESEEDIL